MIEEKSNLEKLLRQEKLNLKAAVEKLAADETRLHSTHHARKLEESKRLDDIRERDTKVRSSATERNAYLKVTFHRFCISCDVLCDGLRGWQIIREMQREHEEAIEKMRKQVAVTALELQSERDLNTETLIKLKVRGSNHDLRI